MNKLSWYLNFHINDVNTLFSEQTLPYEVDCYICSCGKTETIIKDAMDSSINYECDNCPNNEFLDANKYINNYIWYEKVNELFNEDFLLSLNPIINFNEEDKSFNAQISVDIPSKVDIVSNKIVYKRKSLFEISISEFNQLEYKVGANFDLELDQNDYTIYFNKISQKDLINKNSYLSIYKLKILKELQKKSKASTLKYCSNLEEFEFFLENYHLKSLDFYKWQNTYLLSSIDNFTLNDALEYLMDNRKEKSLKKAVYSHYKNQMNEYKKFNLIYIFTLSRCIKDVNVLIRMMNINLKEHLCLIEDQYYFYKYIKFLSERFSDKQIESLLLSYEKNEPFWLIDTVSIFSEIVDRIIEIPIEKCKFKYLHTQIVSAHRYMLTLDLFETKFEYESIFTDACISIQNYKIKLPMNGGELYDWSNELQNCLSGYGRLIDSRKTTVFGFFEENDLKFAVEIKDNKIIQSKSKYNEDLEQKDISLVISWYKQFFEKDK